MATTTTRASLLLRLREGDDAEAWREIDARYRPLLLRVCAARGLQPADADDVAQQVLAGLLRGVRRFEYDPERGRFRDYLCRCVENALADRRRREARRTGIARPVDLAEPELAAPEEPLGAVFEREWIKHHYRMAIERLLDSFDPRGAEIFHSLVAGLSVADVARTLGMSEGAVYKAMERTRVRLRELVAEQIRWEEDSDG